MIVQQNILNTSVISTAAQLEELRLFEAAERIVELATNGRLPIGAGAERRTIERYFRNRGDRLTVGERRSLYSRVLGVPGGELPTGIEPNSQFGELWIRFVAAVSEDARSGGGGGAVRQAGRELAENLSLHGSGIVPTAARKLKGEISEALEVARLQEVGEAFGVTGIWRVVEQVARQEFGAAVNVVKHRTMAESGGKILDVLARRAGAWSGAADTPLFRDARERDDLVKACEAWLAVSL